MKRELAGLETQGVPISNPELQRRQNRDRAVEEVRALLAVCDRDPSPIGERDAALIALIAVERLFAPELVRLDIQDYEAQARTLCVNAGRRGERVLHLDSEVSKRLDEWIRVRGRRTGPLFWPVVASGGLVTGARIGPLAIYFRIKRRALQAGLDGYSSGDLRSACPDRATMAAAMSRDTEDQNWKKRR